MLFGLSPEAMNEFWTNLPATIAAIGSIIAVILSHRSASKQRREATTAATAVVNNAANSVGNKIDDTSNKLTDANLKLDDIKLTTNGTLDTALKRIDALELLVTDLKGMKDRRKEEDA
jgi:hypothetical protein